MTMMVKVIINNISVMKFFKPNIKAETFRFGFFVILSISFFSCQDTKEDSRAMEIVEKSIEAHAGIAAWNTIKTLSFDKTTMLFLEDGSIERRLDQRQTFHFEPVLKGTIEEIKTPWKKSYSYDNGVFHRTENDSTWEVTDQNDIDALKYSFFAAHYVVCQPFELLSDNATLSFGGETTVNERKCYIVDVTYKDDDENADKWSYVFDAETYEVVANKVVLSDHTSWIENLTYDTSTGIKFNAERKSYRLDENGEKMYLRAEYFYSNYSIQ